VPPAHAHAPSTSAHVPSTEAPAATSMDRLADQLMRMAPGEGAEPPDDFVCPITQELMVDPCFAADGHTYERHAIERWLQTKSNSPKTGCALELTAVFPNHLLRRQIREWQERHTATTTSAPEEPGASGSPTPPPTGGLRASPRGGGGGRGGRGRGGKGTGRVVISAS
jgi:hypothetical protein